MEANQDLPQEELQEFARKATGLGSHQPPKVPVVEAPAEVVEPEDELINEGHARGEAGRGCALLFAKDGKLVLDEAKTAQRRSKRAA